MKPDQTEEIHKEEGNEHKAKGQNEPLRMAFVLGRENVVLSSPIVSSLSEG